MPLYELAKLMRHEDPHITYKYYYMIEPEHQRKMQKNYHPIVMENRTIEDKINGPSYGRIKETWESENK